MKLIVGLGNPGDKYQNTRHNLGFAVVDELAFSVQRSASSWKNDKKLKAEIMQFNYTLDASSYTLLLAKPQTYMNNSGMAVLTLNTYYKIHNTDLIIIHDDLDLPLGKIKIRLGGAAGGHHGVESIIKYLGTDKFIRVRIGIGNIHALEGEKGRKHFDAEKFVVDEFSSGEQTKVKKIIKESVEALKLILEKGLEIAQNQYN